MREIKLSTPECIWPARAVLGEGPVWDRRCGSLYWVDIKGRLVHRCDERGGGRVSWNVPEMIGCLVPEGPVGHFWAGAERGFCSLVLGEGRSDAVLERLADPEFDIPGNRFNDGKRAPDGSFWAGTMDAAEKEASGSWWRFSADGACRKLDQGYHVTNGPAFDSARGRVYLTDSALREIYVADLTDGGSGFEAKRLFHCFDTDMGYPDGMTVDEDGGLWIAFWDGACLRRLDPDAGTVQEIAMPVRRPTSIAMNGDVIFVTSAATGLTEGGLDGGLFRIERLT